VHAARRDGTRLTPVWLRPAVLAIVAALHGAILLGLPALQPPAAGSAPAVEVSILPEGDPASEIAPSGAPAAASVEPTRELPAEPPGVAGMAAPPGEPSPQEPEAPASEASRSVPPPMIATPPVQPGPEVAPDPQSVMPTEVPLPRPIESPPNVEPARPIRQEPRAAERQRKIQREKAEERADVPERERAEQRRAAQARRDAQAREAARRADEQRRRLAAATATPSPAGQAPIAGASGGRTEGAGGARAAGDVSSSAYAARVRTILQARANTLGLEDVEGVVGISFSVGPSGRLVSHGISRASGNFAIDSAIRSMLGSLSFPPPPGGSFSGNVTVRVR
jgi:periplasmic protein TonB